MDAGCCTCIDNKRVLKDDEVNDVLKSTHIETFGGYLLGQFSTLKSEPQRSFMKYIIYLSNLSKVEI